MTVLRVPTQAFAPDSSLAGPSRDTCANAHWVRMARRRVLALAAVFSDLRHLGVFEVLEQERIPVAGIVGTHLGSLLAPRFRCIHT